MDSIPSSMSAQHLIADFAQVVQLFFSSSLNPEPHLRLLTLQQIHYLQKLVVEFSAYVIPYLIHLYCQLVISGLDYPLLMLPIRPRTAFLTPSTPFIAPLLTLLPHMPSPLPLPMHNPITLPTIPFPLAQLTLHIYFHHLTSTTKTTYIILSIDSTIDGASGIDVSVRLRVGFCRSQEELGCMVQIGLQRGQHWVFEMKYLFMVGFRMKITVRLAGDGLGRRLRKKVQMKQRVRRGERQQCIRKTGKAMKKSQINSMDNTQA